VRERAREARGVARARLDKLSPARSSLEETLRSDAPDEWDRAFRRVTGVVTDDVVQTVSALPGGAALIEGEQKWRQDTFERIDRMKRALQDAPRYSGELAFIVEFLRSAQRSKNVDAVQEHAARIKAFLQRNARVLRLTAAGRQIEADGLAILGEVPAALDAWRAEARGYAAQAMKALDKLQKTLEEKDADRMLAIAHLEAAAIHMKGMALFPALFGVAEARAALARFLLLQKAVRELCGQAFLDRAELMDAEQWWLIAAADGVPEAYIPIEHAHQDAQPAKAK
jgi:hypothetical protein